MFTAHASYRELENKDYLDLMSQASSKDASVAKKWKEIKKRPPVRNLACKREKQSTDSYIVANFITHA